jgi:hypothetical protein
MNVELKLSVPLAQLTAVAAALAAVMGAEGVAAAAVLTDTPATTDKPAATEVKSGKGKKSAAPADKQDSADKQADASANTTESPTPSTQETQPAADTKPAAKARQYADTDMPDRIVKIVAEKKATGKAVRLDALKAHLKALGLESARDLKPEQLDAFEAKLAEIEAMPLDAADDDVA